MDEKTLFVAGLFVAVALLTFSFAAPVLGQSARGRRRLRSRIKALASDEKEIVRVSLIRRQYLNQLSPFERRLESLEIMQPMVRLLSQAGVELPAHRIFLLSLGCAAGGWIVGSLLFRSPLLTALMVAGAAAAPTVTLLTLKRKRQLAFEEQLPDALSMLSRTLRAGLPLSQALQVASQELEGPVAEEFGIVFTELNYGGDLRTALNGMLERVQSMTVMALSTSILIQRETGGNLAEVVSQLERLMRERFRFQRSLRTLTAANRTSAWIVMLMPFALAGMLELNSPGYMDILLSDPKGVQLIYAALGLQVLGMLWVRQMVKIDV